MTALQCDSLAHFSYRSMFSETGSTTTRKCECPGPAFPVPQPSCASSEVLLPHPLSSRPRPRLAPARGCCPSCLWSSCQPSAPHPPPSDCELLLLQLQDPRESQSHRALEVEAAASFSTDLLRAASLPCVPPAPGALPPRGAVPVWTPGVGPAGSRRSCPHPTCPQHASNKSHRTRNGVSVTSP